MCVFIAVAALADFPPGDDVLGLYTRTDELAQIWRGCSAHRVSGPQEIYLVASGVTDPAGMLGWECRVVVPSEIFFTGATLAGDATNMAIAPDFSVSLTSPLAPANGVALLASVSFFVSPGLELILLYLEPATQGSVPGKMVYLSGSDPGVLIPFAWSSGDPSNPVFYFNIQPCARSSGCATWGAVKNLHR